MDINKVTLIGKLTNEPERIDDRARIAFQLATSYFWKDAKGNKKESGDCHQVIVSGKLADIVESYVKKGNRIYIEGLLRNTDIIADEIIMLGHKA